MNLIVAVASGLLAVVCFTLGQPFAAVLWLASALLWGFFYET